MAGQCLAILSISYTYRSVESWDKKKIAALKKALWALVVESKWGLNGRKTNFDMKYVPEYSTLTELHAGKGPQVQRSRIEMRNLRAFAAGMAILLVVSYGMYRIVTGLVKALRWLW